VPFIKVIGCEEVRGRSFHSIILNQRISIARKVSSLRTMLPKELIGTFFYKELLGTLRWKSSLISYPRGRQRVNCNKIQNSSNKIPPSRPHPSEVVQPSFPLFHPHLFYIKVLSISIYPPPSTNIYSSRYIVNLISSHLISTQQLINISFPTHPSYPKK
jgi:hypothetical protein